MSVLINIVIPVFLVAGVAALLEPHLGINVQSVSRASFYLFSPALIFSSLALSDISGTEFGRIALALLLLTLALWGLGELGAKALRLSGPTRGGFLITILLANSGNFGFPVTLFAFGEAGLARAALYLTVSSTLMATLGVYLAARGSAPASVALKRVFRVPMVYAGVLGMLVNLSGVTLPEPLIKALTVLGAGAVPALLVVLGMQLSRTFRGRLKLVNLPALGVVTVGRLLVAPALGFAVAGLLGLTGLSQNVFTLESAMPTAVMAIVLATEFDSDLPFVSVAVFVTTLGSLLTLTLLLNGLM